jgi:hypothetical protein
LVHFTPKGEIVNSQNYCDVLRKKLKNARSDRNAAEIFDGKLVKDATKTFFFETLEPVR